MAGNFFYGFHITGPVCASVLQTVDKLRPEVPRASWTDSNKLHVTLLFAGKTYRGGDDLQDMTNLCLRNPPLRLGFYGAGTFNNKKGPRVLFARPVQMDVLRSWHAQLGGNADTFTPHLTLAKLEEVGDAEPDFANMAQSLSKQDFGSCLVDEIRLYQTMGEGQPYRIVAWHRLVGKGKQELPEYPF